MLSIRCRLENTRRWRGFQRWGANGPAGRSSHVGSKAPGRTLERRSRRPRARPSAAGSCSIAPHPGSRPWGSFGKHVREATFRTKCVTQVGNLRCARPVRQNCSPASAHRHGHHHDDGRHDHHHDDQHGILTVMIIITRAPTRTPTPTPRAPTRTPTPSWQNTLLADGQTRFAQRQMLELLRVRGPAPNAWGFEVLEPVPTPRMDLPMLDSIRVSAVPPVRGPAPHSQGFEVLEPVPTAPILGYVCEHCGTYSVHAPLLPQLC